MAIKAHRMEWEGTSPLYLLKISKFSGRWATRAHALSKGSNEQVLTR
jgi:hypothetical protein